MGRFSTLAILFDEAYSSDDTFVTRPGPFSRINSVAVTDSELAGRNHRLQRVVVNL